MVSATAGTTLNVNLLLATGGIVAVEATDESRLLVQAASGTPRDGASVPTDTINVVSDGPTALRLTWAGPPRATDNFLLIESDVSRLTIVQPVTNDLNGAGSIYSVKARAKEFSDWGDGGETGARFSKSDDGVATAESCVG